MFAFFAGELGGQALQPHQDAVIVDAERLLDKNAPIPIEKTRVFTTSRDGSQIYFESTGEADTALVFVHGWTCDLHDWLWQLPAFSSAFFFFAFFFVVSDFAAVSWAKTTATLPRTSDRPSISVISFFIAYLLWDGAN